MRRPRLVAVSNRLPAVRPREESDEARGHPVGGLVSALQPALEERRGLWFGWSGRTTTGRHGRPPRPVRFGRLALVPIDLGEAEVELYYTGHCNRTLWPVLHQFQGRLQFSSEAAQTYLEVNRRFAAGLLDLLRGGDTVWVHDYHLFPLGSLLREGGFAGRIGFFLHTPFPPPDVIEILPGCGELIRRMGAYDLVGFHTERYRRNFVETARREGAIAGRAGLDFRSGRLTRSGVYPIGCNMEPFRRWAASPEAEARRAALRAVDHDRKILVSVDRLDYTKGIPERLRALSVLLARWPQWRRRVRLIQISAPSRTRVPEYVRQKSEVDRLVGEINGRWSAQDWAPVRYLYQSVVQDELAALYRLADVCLVTPLRDGMNLVAKEFIASQSEDDPGVLVLSRFCGAAEELDEALLVNPYDTEATAAAIARALDLPLGERRRRWRRLFARCSASTARTWRDGFLADLEQSGRAVPLRRPTAR